MHAHPFLQSEEFLSITEKTFFRSLLTDVPADSTIIFDLTFQGAFAKRMFDILKREGPSVQGFERMQQTFLESVEKIRQSLVELEQKYFIHTTLFLEKTKEASTHLTALVGDLSVLKNWQLRNEETMTQKGKYMK